MKLRSQIREKLNDLYAGNIKANVMVASWETFVKVRDEILALFDEQEKKLRQKLEKRNLWKWVEELPKENKVCLSSMNYAIRSFVEKEVLG